eukprot:jgi/Mesen1/760/ME000110S_11026
MADDVVGLVAYPQGRRWSVQHPCQLATWEASAAAGGVGAAAAAERSQGAPCREEAPRRQQRRREGAECRQHPCLSQQRLPQTEPAVAGARAREPAELAAAAAAVASAAAAAGAVAAAAAGAAAGAAQRGSRLLLLHARLAGEPLLLLLLHHLLLELALAVSSCRRSLGLGLRLGLRLVLRLLCLLLLLGLLLLLRLRLRLCLLLLLLGGRRRQQHGGRHLPLADTCHLVEVEGLAVGPLSAAAAVVAAAAAASSEYGSSFTAPAAAPPPPAAAAAAAEAGSVYWAAVLGPGVGGGLAVRILRAAGRGKAAVGLLRCAAVLPGGDEKLEDVQLCRTGMAQQKGASAPLEEHEEAKLHLQTGRAKVGTAEGQGGRTKKPPPAIGMPADACMRNTTQQHSETSW